jgi:hypothetical protein
MAGCRKLQKATLTVLLGLACQFGEAEAQVSSAAGSAAEVSRLLDQAKKLETAAALCREKVRSGQMSDCKVEVNFQDNRLVSPSTADSLAAQLRTQARQQYFQIKLQLERDKQALEKRESRGQSDRLNNSDSTTRDVFGTRKSNAKFPIAEAGQTGSNRKAGDQLKAAALEAKKGDKGDFRKNFDEGGAQSDGSLAAAHTLGAGPLPIDLSHFSERAKKDPQIVASLNNLSKLESKRMQVDKELNQLTAQRNAAKDPGTMKELTKKLDQENKVKQANLVAITNTTQEIEKRHREIDY